MQDETEPKWETVSGDTRRLKVPGGWIYAVAPRLSGHYNMAAVFVPEPPPVSIGEGLRLASET